MSREWTTASVTTDTFVLPKTVFNHDITALRKVFFNKTINSDFISLFMISGSIQTTFTINIISFRYISTYDVLMLHCGLLIWTKGVRLSLSQRVVRRKILETYPNNFVRWQVRCDNMWHHRTLWINKMLSDRQYMYFYW